jgi:hypothetical protein
MRTLIHFSSHITTPNQTALLLAQYNLCKHLNPDCDIAIVDSAGPIDPRTFLPGDWETARLLNDDDVPTLKHGTNTLIRFKESIGHPYHDRLKVRAGPCRAWMKGIEAAIRNDYDRVVYYEYDLFFAHPAKLAFDMMQKPVGTGGPIALENFDEVGLFFADIEYLWKSNFVERYNWRGATVPLGEIRMMQILDQDGARQVLPIKLNRDRYRTSPDDFHLSYPNGLDALTHAKTETMYHFLKVWNLEHCWPGGPPEHTPAPPPDMAHMLGLYDNNMLAV